MSNPRLIPLSTILPIGMTLEKDLTKLEYSKLVEVTKQKKKKMKKKICCAFPTVVLFWQIVIVMRSVGTADLLATSGSPRYASAASN